MAMAQNLTPRNRQLPLADELPSPGGEALEAPARRSRVTTRQTEMDLMVDLRLTLLAS